MNELEETETLEEETQELNEGSTELLDMTDEEFEEYMAQEQEPVIPEDSMEEGSEEEVEESDDTEDTDEPTEEEEVTVTDEDQTDETSTEDGDTESLDTDTESNKDETKEEPKEDEPETSKIDYQTEYEKILAPFKANGREIKVDNIDDARQLMQMGANYNKKMAALKPNLKALKTLETNDLLNEDKLNFLIDLANKKPEAINKLVQDANLDPIDFDKEEASKYVPGNHSVSDAEVALDNVIDDIKGNESFNKTMEVVTKVMDDRSQAVLVQQPDIIKAIDTHIQSGVYDQVMAVVDRERMLGRLNGLSDLEAYKKVGDQLFAEQTTQETQPQTPMEESVPKTVSEKPDPIVVAKKKAAGSVKSRPVKKQPEFDPLSMSDEEFEKIAGSNFY
jgi:hypothetical protein